MAGLDDGDNLTVQILSSIRDEIGHTNERIDQLREATTSRLDHLSTGLVHVATEVASLRGEVVELRSDVVELRTAVNRQTARFDHFLDTEGNVVRDLRHRVERLEDHTGIDRLPKPR